MDLSLGEYNFGGADNVSGGLAQADLFGIFARERLDLAFFWHTPEGTQTSAWQLFRNYDGAKGQLWRSLFELRQRSSRCIPIRRSPHVRSSGDDCRD